MNNEEISLVTKDNKDASELIRSFLAFCHCIDDVVDNDKEQTDESIIKVVFDFTIALSVNPFYQANKGTLLPLILHGYSCWLDANKMEDSEDVKVRQSSDTLKGFYHEVVWHCALLCGGYDHWRAVTLAHRKYDYDH